MATVNIAIPHDLGQEEATRRLQARFHTVKDQFGGQISDLEEEWAPNGLKFGFRVLGLKVSGSVASEPSEVQVAAELPMAAMMFKSTLEQQIRAELSKMLTG